MSNKSLRYALIGCGQAGWVHAFHFAQHPAVVPVVCIDTAASRAQRTQEEFGFSAWATTIEEGLRKPLDMISIATPPHLHGQHISAALTLGVPVLCEKPLLHGPAEIAPVFSLSQQRGTPLGVMLPRRFYNNSLATRRALHSSRLGTIRRVQFHLECRKDATYYGTWRGQKAAAGGGVLMSQAIHSIDQLAFFFGPPREVRGRVWTTRSSIEVEDEAEATIVFRNGVTVDLRATNNSINQLWRGVMTIEGERGRIVLDSENVVEWAVPGAEPPPPEEAEVVPVHIKPAYYGPGHRKVIHSFVESLAERTPLVVSAQESLAALHIIWGIYQSSVTGREVSIG